MLVTMLDSAVPVPPESVLWTRCAVCAFRATTRASPSSGARCGCACRATPPWRPTSAAATRCWARTSALTSPSGRRCGPAAGHWAQHAAPECVLSQFHVDPPHCRVQEHASSRRVPPPSSDLPMPDEHRQHGGQMDAARQMLTGTTQASFRRARNVTDQPLRSFCWTGNAAGGGDAGGGR